MSDKIRIELLNIQNASKDGMLHPKHVVSWAKKNRGSALYRQFEWNNTKAADEFRLWQARRLIQIHVVADDATPQLVSLSFDRKNGGGYRSVRDVISDRELTQVMLNDALAELQRVKIKYDRVRELAGVWNAVNRVRKRTERPRVVQSRKPLAKAA